MNSTRSGGATPGSLSGRSLNFVFVGLLIGNTMAGMDATIVATAGLRIQKDLGSLGSLSVIFTAYQLAQIATMPLYGKLGDLYGRKRVFGFSVALFLVGSVLCGAAPSLTWFIVARVLQGAGAGGLTGLTMAIVADIVPADRLGRYLGYTGLVFAVTSVLGPVFGGLFADGPSWRWAFFVNLPSGIVCFWALAKVPQTAKRTHHRVDLFGALLLAGIATCVTLVANWGGRSMAWDSPRILAMSCATFAMIVAFVMWERRASEPILPGRIFAKREVTLAVAANFVAGISFFGGIVYLPVYFQSVAGNDATRSGLLLIPFAFATAIGTTLVGQVVQRTQRGVRAFPIAGMLLMLIGFSLLANIDTSTSVTSVMVFGSLVGVGIGFVMQVMLYVVQRRSDPRDLGAATGVTILARIAGSVVGVAVAGNVLNSRIANEFVTRGVALTSKLQGDAASIRALSEPVRSNVVASFSASVATTFAIFVPIMLVGFVLALWLPRNLDQRVQEGCVENMPLANVEAVSV